ncbi:MAG: serine/threonine-protein phosphatase [Chloroflexi bacterium]|jgi:serine/threonine protein phosphatase PrpC|nr:serine/threonine-protein phosphatase [Chloroflexota bacterium]
MPLSTATLSTASDPLPIGEYVIDAERNVSYVITAFDEGTPANSRTRTYHAVVSNDAATLFLLHEGLSPLDLAGTLLLSERWQDTALPHVARLLPAFHMPWFERVVRHYVPEVVAPDLMSVAWMNQQSKKQWEAWFEQLVAGLDALHDCGVALGLKDEEGTMRHIGVNATGAHWRNLGTLVVLSDQPDAAYADVRALCATFAHTRLLEAPSHIRFALHQAADPAERMSAAMLLNRLRRVAPSSSTTGCPTHVELGWATSPGMVRAENEDRVYAMHVATAAKAQGLRPILLAVADGMGGVEAGEVASDLAIRMLAKAVQDLLADAPHPSAEVIAQWLPETIRTINEAVIAEGNRLGNQMGSTLAFALVVDGRAYLGNVGDSRIYLWRSQEADCPLIRLTKDHSLVQSLVDAGLLRDEDRYTHPERSLIYRSLGDPKAGISDALEPVTIQPGDWLMVCSDGLWEMVRDDAIREMLAVAPNAQVACDRLIDLANANGGEDNIAVAIARFW